MKYLVLLFSVAFFGGCALMPPTESARIKSDRNMKEVALMLETQANKCWEKGAGLLGDGIRIDSRMSLTNTALISASRWAHDIGEQDDFFVIEVIEDDNQSSTVLVKEGDFACHLTGSCYQLGFTNDVKRWVNGELSCKLKP